MFRSGPRSFLPPVLPLPAAAVPSAPSARSAVKGPKVLATLKFAHSAEVGAISPLTGDFYVSTMPVDNGNANTIVVYAG
jgi:hypothetical protein